MLPPAEHRRALARMALVALSLEGVTGLKYLHFKEVHTCFSPQSVPLLTCGAYI